MSTAQKRVVIATTTYAKYSKRWEEIRAECALKTLKAAAEHGYQIVCVDGGSPDSYVQKMRSLGAVVWQQTQPGMGNARREALRHALDLSCQAIVWIEPEKYPMVPLLHAGVRAIVDEGFDLAMFRRLTLDSYPPEQAMAYKMAGLAFQYLYGFDCDYGFGPLCMSPRAATEYFLSYHGEYGDVWDSIHIPKLRMIVEGQPFTIIDVDYRHPPEQTEAETGVELFMKRVEQISQITDAVFRESQRLQA